MGTTRFVLRTDKPDQNGECAIQLVYQVSGQRKYYNTGNKVNDINWDSNAQRAVYLDRKSVKKLLPNQKPELFNTSTEIDDINDSLTQLDQQIKEIEKRFKFDRVSYSSQMVIQNLKESKTPLTKKDESHTLLFEFIDKYISDHATTRAPGSLGVYKALKSHLESFQTYTGRRISFQGINYSFFQEFQNFLITERRLSNTTVAKQLSTVKTFLNYAKMHGVVVSERYKDFKIRRENLEVIALTNDEFETLYSMDLSKNRRLDQVRDVFCFSCATGLRYSDLSQLKWEHIKGDEIRLTIKKTKETLSIPLNPYSSTLIKKYKGRHRPLPVISNQKMNQYLNGKDEKDEQGRIIKHHPGLCEIAGINEPIEIVRFRGSQREAEVYPKYELISVHTGRKTFATLSLEKGMSAEEVMTITGHRDYKSFKRYVKVTEQRKKIVMSKAWGEIKDTLKADK